ncbi:hypothetical protein [Geothrix sp. 21YS21S-4]|uniref:hypothetical protein n=1 Tax=Geothrix sp. 21YS21S-4 TaxID=3068889 RepID=UPI0027BA4038|nr:hypothetical protein [Geothrix sp. 21YS21S-4]
MNPTRPTLEKGALLGLLMKARRYLDIAHHVRGRIRITFDFEILALGRTVDLPSLRAAFERIHGVRNVRWNLMAGSLVVEYDPALLLPAWWETLVHGSSEGAETVLEALLGLSGASPIPPVQKEVHR